MRAFDRHGEGGFAMASAIIVLLLLTLLTGLAVTISAQTSTSTTRDQRVKAAFEAAEAGLQIAAYRLGQLQPASTECTNESANEVPSAASTYCKASSVESLGNGATTQYWTSLPLAAGKTCAGRTVEKKEGSTQRCITAEGKVGAISQRVELLTESTSSAGLFSVAGVLGLEEVKVSGSVTVPGVVATNGKIIGEGSANFEKGYELCPPKGSFTPAVGAERKASGVKIAGKNPEADPPLEKTRAESECPFPAAVPASHATASINEDSRIGKEDEFSFPEGKGGKEPSSKFTGSPNFELKLGANAKLTLGGSRYYLCNFIAESNSKLVIAANAKIELFIDSPGAEGSACKPGTGKFGAGGSFVLENLAKKPSALLIVMSGAGPFEFTNGNGSCSGACLEASIYAPKAEVNINGGTSFKGGIVGKDVHLENGAGLFEWSSEDASLGSSASGYARTAWEQCAPGSGATEGC